MTVADNLVFLYPNAGVESDEAAHAPRTRPTFIVSITLSIPLGAAKPAPIKSLVVQLTGSESLGVSVVDH
jgi:hypothetical protein